MKISGRGSRVIPTQPASVCGAGAGVRYSHYDGSAPPVQHQLRVVHESTRRGRRRAVSGIGWSIPITHSGRHLPSMRPTPLAFIAHLVLMPRLSNTLINAAPIRASKPRPFFITPSLPPPSSSSALLAHAPPLPPPALAV
jgi:hypothetical protein